MTRLLCVGMAVGQRMSKRGTLVFLGMIVSQAVCAAPLSMAEFGQIAQSCGPQVAPSTLASIAEVESRLQPLAIYDNTSGTTNLPADREGATRAAGVLLAKGHSLDLGLMQINSANFGKLGITAEQAFDPCVSIGAAAKILAGGYAGGDTRQAQQTALRQAISSYNTGDNKRGFENGYVHKVELAARQVVPSLDVGPVTPAGPAPRAAPADQTETVDKDAPPSWDVWASLTYEETGKKENQPRPTSQTAPGAVTEPTLRESTDAGDPSFQFYEEGTVK